jgi:hypothetical protein
VLAVYNNMPKPEESFVAANEDHQQQEASKVLEVTHTSHIQFSAPGSLPSLLRRCEVE